MNEGLFSGSGSGVFGPLGRFSYQIIEVSQYVSPPSWAKYVSILGCGGGGGGGGGRIDSTGNAGGGGGGGGGGAKYIYRFPLFMFRQLADKFNVTIAAGGTSGPGSTTNAINGTAGGAGGQTRAILTAPNIADSRIQGGIIVFGGNGGTGGSTANANGGTGGASYSGNTGNTGGIGLTSSTSSLPDGRPTWTNGPVCMGGYGGAGKGATQNAASFPFIPVLLMPQYAAAQSTATFTDGPDAELYAANTIKTFLNSLTRAPMPHDLWFTSFYGGMPGQGSATVGYNGGKGFRGSGGGGGGGGFSTNGGNGGVGGNGVVYFFWEEV